MSSPAVALDNVTVSFPLGRRVRGARFVALDDLSIRIGHGQKLAVLGRNGAGKSTLLRVIAGTITPDSGVVARTHGRCQLLTLGAGFVRYLSGRDNAIMQGLYFGCALREIKSKLPAIRAFADIGAFFDRPVATYSAGMRVRLAFSVAIQLDPDILLLDEILGVGDREFREKSAAAVRERLSSDATIVLASHEERTIADYCDTAAWIEHGRMVASGPVGEVLERYRRCPSPETSTWQEQGRG